MRPEAALADRRQSVREAAREWVRAGWVDADAYRKIEEMYPDDRVRTGLAFRILFFALTLAAIGGLLGAVYSQIDHAETAAVFALAAGCACWGITEHLTGSARRREGGIEAAFSVAAVGNLIIGLTIFLIEYHGIQERWAVTLVLFFLALFSGIAAWRWGYWPYMAISAASSFCAVMSLPTGRLWWILALGIAYRWLVIGCDSGRLPPSLRKFCAAFLTVALLGLYAAVNVFLLDQHSLSWFHGHTPFPRWLSICLTAALPCLLFWIGIIRRRRVFLLLGFGFALLSILTLRMYIHVAPPWLLLAGAGVLLIISAAALRRFLESSPSAEKGGFTAAPLTGQSERHRALELAASIAALTPGANEAADKSGFRGGGGGFGGGGSSGKF